MRSLISGCLLVFMLLTIPGCTAPAALSAAPTLAVSIAPAEVPTSAPSATSAPTATATSAPTATPAPTLIPPSATPTTVVYGPGNFPANINPLTGLAVSDPSKLALPPAMISISNFPVTARPQFGLATTPFVYEVYTGYGMTRFLATVYGDLTASNGQPAVYGPIRSGRLPYEPLRMMMNGFMLIASGDETVLGELKMFTSVWNPENTDVNGVSVDSRVVENTAQQYLAALGKPVLDGLVFDPRPPQGGKTGKQLWVPYSGANQVIWKYDAASDGYNRYQDNYDGKTANLVVDGQTSKPLVYENVVVVFAPHNALQPEKIDIGLAFVKQAPALLFRDGKIYEISWSSQDLDYYNKTGKIRMMRFVDALGNPVPLKPGQTWVEVVTGGSPVFETPDTMNYADLYNKREPGSGTWGVLFLAPMPK